MPTGIDSDQLYGSLSLNDLAISYDGVSINDNGNLVGDISGFYDKIRGLVSNERIVSVDPVRNHIIQREDTWEYITEDEKESISKSLDDLKEYTFEFQHCMTDNGLIKLSVSSLGQLDSLDLHPPMYSMVYTTFEETDTGFTFRLAKKPGRGKIENPRRKVIKDMERFQCPNCYEPSMFYSDSLICQQCSEYIPDPTSAFDTIDYSQSFEQISKDLKEKVQQLIDKEKENRVNLSELTLVGSTKQFQVYIPSNSGLDVLDYEDAVISNGNIALVCSLSDPIQVESAEDPRKCWVCNSTGSVECRHGQLSPNIGLSVDKRHWCVECIRDRVNALETIKETCIKDSELAARSL